MANSPAYIKDGTEWLDHEDCLVANKQGLRNLIAACEKTLDQGEYYGNDLGDYVGVKKLDSSWFLNPEDSKKTTYLNKALGAFLLLVLGATLVGFFTIFNWLF